MVAHYQLIFELRAVDLSFSGELTVISIEAVAVKQQWSIRKFNMSSNQQTDVWSLFYNHMWSSPHMNESLPFFQMQINNKHLSL